MKRIILIVALFLAGIAISPHLIGEKGYILIAMGDITIESTVVTAGLMLVVLLFTLILSLKIFKGGLNISFAAWNKVIFANRRKAKRQFNQGVAAYILEDNQQAEHLLVKSATGANEEQLAYLLAASASDKQGLPTNTKYYLSQLDECQDNLKNVGLESILVTIKLLLKHEELSEARILMDQHHKNISHDDRLLALEIDLSLMEQRYVYVVEQLNKARKSKLIEQIRIEQWEAQAFEGAFNEQITQHDSNTLNKYWNNLPRKVKQREQVLYAYCKVLANHSINQPLNKILLPALKKGANSALLKQVRTLPLTDTEELIIAVQRQLHHDQSSAKWLSCLAHLALNGQQFDMAEKAFNSLVHLEGEQYDDIDLKQFAKVLQHQGQLAKAIEILQKLV